jgi:hypothetical protein
MEPPASAPTSPAYIRPYKLDIENPSGYPAYEIGSSYERPQVVYRYTPEPIYRAAKGGVADLAKMRKSLKGAPRYIFADNRRDSSMEAAVDQNFAAGGQPLPPRFLAGGGDGMSDSIKANIDGKQEARLADGEFVVPADVVSHLGNGSSKAGAKKLYSMMDRIRKARTGQKRQAPEVKVEKYMPA